MGRLASKLALLLPGTRERREQVESYAHAWASANSAALSSDGPLWIALGDSSAQGIGASAFDRGYVGRLLELLREQRDPAWRVVNLSRSGAVTDHVIDTQLPQLAALPKPDLVTIAIGSNDLLKRREPTINVQVEKTLRALPAGTVVGNCPQGLARRKTAAANLTIRRVCAELHLPVADIHARTGAPWAGKYAADKFHPNDRGYEDWTAAFADVLDLDFEPPTS